MTEWDRLLELSARCRRIWAPQSEPYVVIEDGRALVRGIYGTVLLAMPQHARSLDALDAALRVLDEGGPV